MSTQSKQRLPSIAIIHNHYQQPGGEDTAVAADQALLESHGHTVTCYNAHNRDVEQMSSVAAAASTVWSARSKRDLLSVLRRAKPKVAHFHNTFPLISPSAYSAARETSVAVVQTLHNFRLLCANALLFRDGRPCEECVHKRMKWPGVVHACYRGSRPATAAVTAMLALHSARGTWGDDVDVYVALSGFAREKFVAGGLPAEKILVRPNFLAEDPGQGEHRAGYALFVGRLSPEKGVETLLEAWRILRPPLPLRIVGDGVLGAARGVDMEHVEMLGRRSHHEVIALMREAAFLVVPSTCYENFPMVVAEAFATGLPVIASGIGATAEIVEDGVTGRHFVAGDADALASTMEWAFAHPRELESLGRAARDAYKSRYTPAIAYSTLRDVYATAIRRNAERS